MHMSLYCVLSFQSLPISESWVCSLSLVSLLSPGRPNAPEPVVCSAELSTISALICATIHCNPDPLGLYLRTYILLRT
ncbi:hypothetical protein B0H10DRAFT_2017429 [Mycena sp. CBHHK59/15]|nr:hypothetical protein B0H10DRAFT_2017429 [Mycena sp. CBHHK59/15]